MDFPTSARHGSVSQKIWKRTIFLLATAASLAVSADALAQTAPAKRLITAAVDENDRTVLRGNTYPLARAEYDRGPAPASLPLHRMILVLKRSQGQEAALDALLDQQQDKASPNYHKWLTPADFGQQFGPADEDIQTITSWLGSHGFEIAGVSQGRVLIEFSGTAAQVSSAFGTEIHHYHVNGEDHWANASDPQIPAALVPAVAGVLTLHNFPRKAMNHVGGVATRSKKTGKAVPVAPDPSMGSFFTLPAAGGCGVQAADCYAVSPSDFLTIYNVLPLWNATPPINGTNQTIAIVAESNIDTSDVTSFRNYFGLPNPPNLTVTVSGPDPMIVGGAETEALLDTEWAGAIAPNAMINLVVAQSTEVSLGADLAAIYAVDNNLAPVLNVSFGICELGLGTTGNQFFNQLWQQAAAQGTTVDVATGDSGAAVCDRGDGPPPAPAVFGLTVSGFSTTPYNVAIGGTDFNDLTDASTYWNISNSAPAYNPNALHTASAKSYIPETTWDVSCTNPVFGNLLGFSKDAETNCNNPQLVNFVQADGGSGGKSNCISSDGQHVASCTGGYGKPIWQVGTGVPNDLARDVPDASLYAAIGGPSGSFYIICEADLIPPGFSSCKPQDLNTQFIIIGGTSASAPAFSAIMALVNQQTKSAQGNANYILYKLAAQQPTAFHDVPAGGTIAMPCAKGSPDCIVNNPADIYGVLSGFSTTAGYDLATGLGSVDANNFVTLWDTVTTQGSATTLSLNPTPVSITHGQPVNFTIGVTAAKAGGGTPTGNVSLIASTGPSGQTGVQGFSLSNGSVSGATNALPGGNYTVIAQYPGDGIFGPSTSTPPIGVQVAAESSQTFANLVTFDINGNLTSYSASSVNYGSGFYLFRVDVGDGSASFSPVTGISSNCSKSISSCPTGSVMLTDNGASFDRGSLPLNSKGYAEDQSLTVGSYSISASYPGDSSYKSSSAATNFTINKGPTTASVGVAGSPVQYGNNTEVTVAIVTTSNGAAPTGTVTFALDGSPFPVSTLVYEGFPYQPGHSPPAYAELTVSGTAYFLSLGNHTLVAQYSGDANYAAANSPSTGVTVGQALPFFNGIGAVPSPINLGQSTTLSAQLEGSAEGVAPTGTMTFSDNNKAVSGTITYTTLTHALSASMPYTPATAGTHTISVSYSGDANYLPATSTINATLNVIGPDFSLGANPTPIVVPQPGGSGSTTVTFTALNGLSGTFNLVPQCASLPSESGCSTMQSNVTFSTTVTTATATLIVSTKAPSSVPPAVRIRPTRTGAATVIAFSLLVLAWILRNQRKPRRVQIAFSVFAVLALLTFAACGGGGGGGSVAVGNPGTPVGLDNGATVTFTLGATSHTLPIPINVE